jgi:hypothetical protein
MRGVYATERLFVNEQLVRRAGLDLQQEADPPP